MRRSVQPRGSAAAQPAVGVEWFFGAAMVFSLAYVAIFLWQQGYLPQPFFFDPSDSLMDLFHPAYWGRHGAYSAWYSVYLPLSFVFLRALSNPECYGTDSFTARDCDLWLRCVFFGFFFLNLYLIYRGLRRRDRGTAIPRLLALGLGLPMLHGVDRGNLVIPSLSCFLLAVGPGLGRSLSHVRARHWFLALAINLKGYLLVVILPRLVARHIRWLVRAGFCIAGVYAITYLIQGGGLPGELIENARRFREEASDQFWEKIYASTSYEPVLRFVKSEFSFLSFMSSKVVDTVVPIVKVAMGLALVATCAVYVLASLRARRVSPNKLSALTLSFLFVMTESNGSYALIFLFALIFLERWKGWSGKLVIFGSYLLCLPLDLPWTVNFEGMTYSWWTSRVVYTEYGASAGQILRPAVLLLIHYGLSWNIARELLRTPYGRVLLKTGSPAQLVGNPAPTPEAYLP